MRRSLKFTFFCSLYSLLLASSLQAAPKLFVDSSSIHFGDVTLGSFKDVVLTISDSSDDDATIADILPIGGASSDFSIMSPSTFPATVPAHGSLSIRVRFIPQTTGFRTSSLDIRVIDTELTLLMIGNGVAENSGISLSNSRIDMGIVAPALYRDTIIKLYSTGSDSATINGVFAANGGGDTSFTVYLLGRPEVPFRLAPGDSVSILLRFTGLLPTGTKTGVLSVLSGANPTILLNGDVEWGSLRFEPETMDFGALYYGEIRDSIVYLINDGLADIELSSIEPPFGSVYFIDTPVTPFILHPKDTVSLRVRANPGPLTFNTPDMGAYSPNAQPGTPKGFFTLTSNGFALDAPHHQEVVSYCAKPGSIDLAIQVNDTVRVPMQITRVVMSDLSLVVTSDRSLADTIPSFGSHNFPLHIAPQMLAKDTMIVEFYAGLQRVVSDTLFLLRQPSTAMSSIVTLQIQDSIRPSFEVRTKTPLQEFELDTLIVHLTVSNEDALDIDTASLALSPALANAKIIRIVPEAYGYAVWIASSTPIVSEAGSGIVSFNARRFVSAADSTYVRVMFETPERSGCLLWSDDTVSVPLMVCGSTAEHQLMAGEPIPFSVAIKNTPVTDGTLDLAVQSPMRSRAHIEIRNLLGQQMSASDNNLTAGVQSLALPVSNLKDGIYFIVVTLDSGRAASLKFSKL